MSHTEYRFERHCRTPNSEAYHIKGESGDLGRIDLHFGQNVVYGALSVLEPVTDDQIFELIELIDEQLVLSADVTRDDFVVSVVRGRQIGVFSDDSFDSEDDDEDDDDDDDREDLTNGRRNR
ncbi:MAG: hypothetical protein NZ518_02235 [Dehalococcoidia bacterium]|nr:hypothetical protein [Dehalococcoidia bacterium]